NNSLSNATLIFHNPVESPVQATVEMYSKAFKDDAATVKYKWQFFGIPLRTASATPTFDGSYVREMHENDTPLHWEQLGNSSVLNSFKGYEITQAIPRTVYFQGDLENSDYNSGQLAFTSVAAYPGQHLIGNPYTAAIDISKIVFGDQMLKTVYLYNTGSSEDWANSSADSSNTSYNNHTPGQYIAVPQANAGDAGLQNQIPSMQAFLVKAKANDPAATVSIPYSTANTVVKDTTLQRVKPLKKICILINVKGKKYGDSMWFFSIPNCTHNFDNGWDGEKIFGSSLAPQIFAMEEDGNYQVNSVNDMDNTDIGFWAGIDSTYTMTFTNTNTSLQYTSIYLLDLLENTLTDISQTGTSYTFTALPSDSPEKRFKIITKPNIISSLETYNQANTQLTIFSSQNKIIVQNKSEVAGDLLLFDIEGRAIQTTVFIANGVTTIPMNLPAGVYLAKGKTSQEEVMKRLLIRK
ncbi:MAG: T9SS type A sorting domain-containing protein, partial [Paludibacter sp.]